MKISNKACEIRQLVA